MLKQRVFNEKSNLKFKKRIFSGNKKWNNRHFYQINNNILITIMVGVDKDNLGKLIGASMKIQPSAKLPLDNDMIEHKTKFCDKI